MRLLTPFDVSSELVDMPTVYPLPRMPANLLGLVNLHGRIVPLFDLAALFETTHPPREKRMVLVIGHGDATDTALVDSLLADRRLARIHDVGTALRSRRLAPLIEAGAAIVAALMTVLLRSFVQ